MVSVSQNRHFRVSFYIVLTGLAGPPVRFQKPTPHQLMQRVEKVFALLCNQLSTPCIFSKKGHEDSLKLASADSIRCHISVRYAFQLIGSERT